RSGDQEKKTAVRLLRVSLSPYLLVLNPLLRFDHRAAGVLATVRADDVRGHHRAALRAGVKLLGLQAVVRPTHAGARVRLFAFGYGHDFRFLTTGLLWTFERIHQHTRPGFNPSSREFSGLWGRYCLCTQKRIRLPQWDILRRWR